MKKIILFGAGDYGKKALRFYGPDQVECFADNNPQKTGEYYYGKKVISFEDLKGIAANYRIIISVSDQMVSQIASQLAANKISYYDSWSPATRNVDFNVSSAGARIYSKLGDDISREIFEYRTLKYLTHDSRFITKMVRAVSPLFEKKLSEWNQCKLILCNPSLAEKNFAYSFKHYVSAFADTDISDKQEISQGALSGLTIYPIDHASRFEHEIFVLPFFSDNKKMALDELKRLNVPDNRVFDLTQLIKWENMYFDLPQLSITENEVFIDAGCYNGYTSKAFLKWAGSGKIFAFEPELKQFEICQKELAGMPDISLVNAGLWLNKDTLHFKPQLFGGSHISATGEDYIDVVSLDEYLGDQRVTFIKMDIEGAEVNALKGAARIIESQKPRLAISVYHNPEDILTIPETILRINPSYKFYLRHYTLWNSETVLYAI